MNAKRGPRLLAAIALLLCVTLSPAPGRAQPGAALSEKGAARDAPIDAPGRSYFPIVGHEARFNAVTPTPYPCPQATPELLAVEPLTSPTGELSQVVWVHMGNMEAVTITTESGIFSAPDGRVEVALWPNTTHHLSVEARVKRITDWWGCHYGGYSLHTTRDRNGAPLIIVQEQAGSASAGP